MGDDCVQDRTPGRRTLDSAHFIKWVPVLSLVALMIMQTIYFTRYVAGLEGQVARLVESNAELKTELRAIQTSVSQAAAPTARTETRMEYFEARLNELRSTSNDNSRRLSTLEAANRVKR